MLLWCSLVSADGAWVEKTHLDFADGYEYFYLCGDTCSFWNDRFLRVWRLGSHLYSPASGGLRIIGQDMDIDDDGYLDLPVANWDKCPSWVYWGPDFSARSEINQGNVLLMWSNGMFLGDLDDDGELEISVGDELNWNVGSHTNSYIFGYAGNRQFSAEDAICYPYSCGAQSLQMADLNNDGYLDIVIANYQDYETENSEINSYVFLGPGPFWAREPAFTLPTFGGHLTSVADLNGDRFLDIIFSSNRDTTRGWETELLIFWGHENGTYGVWDTTRLPVCNNWENQVVDLNRDGWLDIVVVNGKDKEGYYTLDRIYWGPDFCIENSTGLPGVASSNITVADVNLDGVLDLVISNWARGPHGAETLAVYSYVRYGPDYVRGLVDSFPTLGAHGNLVADFNDDGWPDIFVGNEKSEWIGYYDTSCVFWGSPGGFDWNNPEKLETHAANDGVWTDLGNLYERKPIERYISSVYQAENEFDGVDSVRLWGQIPEGMSVDLWIRTGECCGWGPWIRVTGGVPENPNVAGTKMQYRLAINLDYKKTTRFSIDSVGVFYRVSKFLEKPVSPAILFQKGASVFYTSPEDGVLSVYDPVGKLVKRLTLEPAQNRSLDLMLGPGVYFLEIKTGTRMMRLKALMLK